MTRLLEGITRFMPHYYSHKNTDKFGDVTVIPNEWYRRILFEKGTLSPVIYKVNDLIKFKLCVEKIPYPQSSWDSSPIVYERTGNGSVVNICHIRANEMPISGKAGYTGDTKFFLAFLPALHRIEQIDKSLALELFDEDVRSINSYIFGWVGIVVTVLLTGICSLGIGFLLWLLNFFQVIPIYKIWIQR